MASQRSGGIPGSGAVAQLVRAPDCRSGGCGFDSRRRRSMNPEEQLVSSGFFRFHADAGSRQSCQQLPLICTNCQDLVQPLVQPNLGPLCRRFRWLAAGGRSVRDQVAATARRRALPLRPALSGRCRRSSSGRSTNAATLLVRSLEQRPPR